MIFQVVPNEGPAHRDLEQLMIAIAGSFDVHVDDGRHSECSTLTDPM